MRNAFRSLCLVVALTLSLPGAALLADDTECSRYVNHGLAPGMSHREVRQAMGGELKYVQGQVSDRGMEIYHRDSTRIDVQYDRMLGRSSARVVSIETRFSERTVDVPDLLRSLRDSFGEPSTGTANLDEGLLHGTALWVDEACDAEVTAFRRLPEWWQPSSSPTIHVQVRSLAFVRTGALNGKAAR